MEKIILIDGIKYKIWTPQKEEDLEKIVIEHIQDIFGKNAIYFSKQKIKTSEGIGSIPDGFVIAFKPEPCWYVIEVEPSSHSPYDHALAQLIKFEKAVENEKSRRKIIDYIYSEIKNDILKENIIKKKIGSGEIKGFLYDFINEDNVSFVIIIEKITRVWKEAFEKLAKKPQFVEFMTFEREGVGLGVHAHFFEPLIKDITKQYPQDKEFREEPIVTTKKIGKMQIPRLPKKMKIENDCYEIDRYNQILINTAEWLIKKGKLNSERCPIPAGFKRNLVNTEPKHKRGDKFKYQKRLSNGLWIELKYSAQGCLREANKLLQHFGYSDEILKFV